MSEITIKDVNGASGSFTPAESGYTSYIYMSTKITQLSNGEYSIYDYNSSNDYRTCRATWILDATQMNNFLAGFENSASSRAKSVELILPSGSGFFLFGADKGDTSTELNPFQVRMIVHKSEGIGDKPFKYFKVDVEFVAESFPSYTPPSQTHPDTDEGNLQIGTISGLRWPDEYAEPDINIDYDTQLSFDGTPYSTSKGTDADYANTILKMRLNLENAAALIEHLLVTVRGNNVTLTPPSDSYIFGRRLGDGAFTAKLIQSVIKIDNPMYNRFEFDLKFSRVS